MQADPEVSWRQELGVILRLEPDCIDGHVAPVGLRDQVAVEASERSPPADDANQVRQGPGLSGKM